MNLLEVLESLNGIKQIIRCNSNDKYIDVESIYFKRKDYEEIKRNGTE